MFSTKIDSFFSSFLVVDLRHYRLKVNLILFVQLFRRMEHFFLLSTKVKFVSFRTIRINIEISIDFLAGRGYLFNLKCRTLIGIHRFGHDVHTIKFSPDSQ